MSIDANISGNWEETSPYVRVNGSWQPAREGYVKVNGIWEKFYDRPTIIYDSFTDADGTLLTNHTPDIGSLTWQHFAGDELRIENNGATFSGNDGFHGAYVDTSHSDVSVIGNFNYDDNEPHRTLFLFRVDDIDNYVFVEIQAWDYFLIQERSNGTVNEISALQKPEMNHGDIITYRVDLSGSSCTLDISRNGASYESLSGTVSVNPTGTRHGIGFITSQGNGQGILNIHDYELIPLS